MEDELLRRKFEKLPVVDIQHIVHYFNLEYGLEFGEDEDAKFKPEHFNYLGVFEVDGVETMLWSVKGDDICGAVQPYGDSFTIGMEYLPGSQKNA